MRQVLRNVWWLIALCGIFDALHATINLLMMTPLPAFRRFASVTAAWDMGIFALAAGACAIAVGLWCAGKDHSWLLSLHGLALGVFGAIAVSPLVKGPLSFRPISLLFTVMAASIGAFALETARTQRRLGRSGWFPIAAGAASIAFALSFIAVGFFVRLEPSIFFIWMGAYFVLCAVFLLWLAFRLRGRARGRFDRTESLSPLPSPRHAH